MKELIEVLIDNRENHFGNLEIKFTDEVLIFSSYMQNDEDLIEIKIEENDDIREVIFHRIMPYDEILESYERYLSNIIE